MYRSTESNQGGTGCAAVPLHRRDCSQGQRRRRRYSDQHQFTDGSRNHWRGHHQLRGWVGPGTMQFGPRAEEH